MSRVILNNIDLGSKTGCIHFLNLLLIYAKIIKKIKYTKTDD